MTETPKTAPVSAVQMPKVTPRADQAASVAAAAAAATAARIAARSVPPQQPPPQHFNQAPAAPVVAPKAPEKAAPQPLPVHEAPAVTNAELLAELQSVHAKLTAHVAASNTFFTMLHAEIAALKAGK